jgi:uncharacterized RDD family membrane protein YckC
MSRADQVAGRVSAAVLEAQGTAHAGVVTRVLAAVVDVAVVVVATLLVDVGAAGLRFAWAPMSFRWPQPAPSVAVGVLLGVAVVYLTVSWTTAGRTYGARLLGLRVLSTRLVRLGWVRSFLRAVACVLFPVGLLWCVVSVTRRSLQDVVFRSVVLYDSSVYRQAEAAGPR